MSARRHPEPPARFGAAGRALWRQFHGALADGFRFSVHELEVLGRAGALADREAALREILDRDGLTVSGSTGQTVLHPAVVELRLAELAVVSLLQRVSVSDTAGQLESPTRHRARKASRARWDRERDDLAAKRKAAGLG